ncbi:MAG: class I SAM-dependent methyltransferase [Candidatus Omnitrophica bacterium]|nr:class I SAM-dependent methyltransferase [Candidatus Omnitrophota bacterium]
MDKNSKKIKEEFGFDSELEAVKEYSLLNQEFMSFNYPLISDEVINRLNIKKACLLDIGTGLGSLACEFAKRLEGSKVYGIDISSQMLDQARKNSQEKNLADMRFLLSDVHNLEFEDAFFDLAVSFGVLHHLKDVRRSFFEIKRVLKEGGSAFIYDLRKDAPPEVVSEIVQQMPPLHQKAFLESIKEALTNSFIEDILKDMDLREYSLARPSYSRQAILKNKDSLRQSKLLGRRFNEILVEVYFKK